MICLRETPREDTEILTRREGTRMCEIYARFGFDGGMFAAYSLRVVEGTSRVVVGVPAAGAGSRPTVRVHFMCVSPLSRSCLVSCADARRASEVGPQPSSPATYLRPIVKYRTTWLMNVNVNTFGNASCMRRVSSRLYCRPPFQVGVCAFFYMAMDPLAVRQAIHDAASKMRGAFLREDPQVQRLCASSHSQPLSPPSPHTWTHAHTRC